MEKKLKELFGEKGFSLIEILVAVSIFALFTSVYVTGQGFNLADSQDMKEELLLKTLCENKINEVIINPPELSVGATLAAEVKSFEEFPEYEYTLEFQQLTIPNLSKLFFQDTDGEEEGQNVLQKRVLEKVGEVLEKIIWQTKVTVKNKETKMNYTLSTWLYKDDEKVDFANF